MRGQKFNGLKRMRIFGRVVLLSFVMGSVAGCGENPWDPFSYAFGTDPEGTLAGQTLRLDALSREAATGGDEVEITGRGLGREGTVVVGDVPLETTRWGQTRITARIPDSLPAGAYTLAVRRGARTSNTLPLRIVPSLRNIDRSTAVAGEAVAVSGTNLGTAGELRLGSHVVETEAWDNAAVRFVVQPTLTAGSYSVSVSSGGEEGGGVALAVRPVVQTVAPERGPAGTPVTLTGTGFGGTQGDSRLLVGGVAATIVAWTPTSITFVVPGSLTVGTADVSLTVGNQVAQPASFVVEHPAPVVSRLLPANGPTGTVVVVDGLNFQAAQGSSVLLFGGASLAPISWSAAAVTFRIPAGTPAGPQSVAVRVAGKTSNSLTFTVDARPAPAITMLVPDTAFGGTRVVAVGSHFGPAELNGAVTVAGLAAVVVSWSETSVVFDLPAAVTAGTQPVVLRVDGQTSAPAALRVRPTLSQLSPAAITAGTSVVLRGAGFGAAQGSVLLGGIPATVETWSASEVRVTTPGALTPGEYDVLLEAGGQTSNSLALTVVAPGTVAVTEVLPATAMVGAPVRIRGLEFGARAAGDEVYFDTLTAPVDAWTDTEIAARVPALPTGTVPLAVEVAGVRSGTVPFTVTSPTSPWIDSLSPAAGTAGTLVTATGWNFGADQGSSLLLVGGATVDVIEWAADRIRFVMPERTAGRIAVLVRVGAENGNTVEFGLVPHLRAVTPARGSVAQTVAVTGSGFDVAQGGHVLRLGTLGLTADLWSSDAIGWTLPVDPDGGRYPLGVVVNGQASNALDFAVVPLVTALSEVRGPWGSRITLSGAHFGAAEGSSTVTVGGVPAVPVSWSSTAVELDIPAGLAAGPQEVVVTVGGEASAPVFFSVSPWIATLAPAGGVFGTRIAVGGTAFGATQATSLLSVGGLAVAPVTWTATQIDFRIPDGIPAGFVDVAVTVAGEASNTLVLAVQPSIDALTPSVAWPGDVFSVVGHHFGASGTARIGGISAAIESWTDTAVTVRVPGTLSAGAHDVMLEVNGQFSNAVPLNVITSTAPALFMVDPASGAAGTVVNLLGAGFGGDAAAGQVAIGGVPAAELAWMTSAIAVTVPALPAGTYDVQVDVAGQLSNSQTFTVTTATSPRILSFAPVAGSAGAEIVIRGERFGSPAGGSLTLGGMAITPTTWTDAEIVFTLPASVPAGIRVLSVTAGGEASNTVNFTVRPRIDAISPNSGVAADIVMLGGVNFGPAAGGSVVRLGGVTVTPASWSESLITFSVPGSVAQGSVLVEVTVGGQTSNAVSFTVTTAPAPAVQSVGPLVATGGTPVLVLGERFGTEQGSSTLTLGGTPVAADSWTNTAVQFTVPDDAEPGETLVAITVAGNTAAGALTVVPTALEAVPAGGPEGTRVTLRGTNFGAAAAALILGPLQIAPASWSAEAIEFDVPAGLAPGTYALAVTAGGQPSNSIEFVVTGPGAPALFALSPVSGMIGEAVVATGVGLGSGGTLTVGGLAASTTAWADDAVTFAIPAGLLPGSHAVIATVGGVASNELLLAVTTPTSPYVATLTPTSGSEGTLVTVTGTNFGASSLDASITLGAYSPPVESWSDTGFTFRIPAGMEAGVHALTVVLNGESSNAEFFTVRPRVDALTPDAGIIGTVFTLTGVHFGAAQGSSTLTVGGRAAVIHAWFSTAITAEVPAGLPLGAADVLLTVAGQPANVRAMNLTQFPPPEIAQVTPGAATAGDSIALDGLYFGAATQASLALGGIPLAADTWSPTRIEFTLPATIPAGVHPLTLVVEGVSANPVTLAVVPTVTSLSASSGSFGDVLVMQGSNFGATQGSSAIRLDGLSLTPDAWSDTEIRYTITALDRGGLYDLTVTVGGFATVAQPFTIVPVFAADVSAGVAGTSVHLTGGGFGVLQGDGVVAIGGQVLGVDTWSATDIDFTLPATLAAGAQTLQVTIGGVAGTALPFTVHPDLRLLVPDPATGGDLVQVSVTGFGPSASAGALYVDGIAMTPASWSPVEYRFALPGSVPGGARSVTAAVNGVETLAPLTFTVRPVVQSVAPASGSAGTVVTLSGTGFGPQGTSTLTLGGRSITPSTWTHDTIVFTVPADVAGGLHSLELTVDGEAADPASFAVDPVLSSVSPASGPGGTPITLNGTNFGASASGGIVLFGATPVTTSSWSDTAIALEIPNDLPGGTYAVRVVVGGRTSGSQSFVVGPTIATLTPTNGTGGTAVTMTGANFGGVAAQLRIGNALVPADAWQNDRIDFTVPNDVTAGTHAVGVTVGGEDSNAVFFAVRPSLTALDALTATAGNALSLSGTNLGDGQGASLLSVAGVSLAAGAWGQTAIGFTLPSEVTAGTQPVFVVVGGENSNGLNLTVQPSILALTPVSGGGGTVVSVQASNLGLSQETSSVTLGGASIAPSGWTHDGFSITLPDSLAGGSHSLAVTVGGQVTTATFTVTPAIDSVSPAAATAGTLVTVTGRNFGASHGASTLRVGGTALASATWTDTQITFVVPPALAAAVTEVAVVVGGVASNAVPFTIDPWLSTVSPAQGSGGDAVGVSATGLGAAQGSSVALLGGVSLAIDTWTHTGFTWTVADDAAPGLQTLSVTVNGRTGNTLGFRVLPEMLALAPVAATSGTTVRVTGTNFGSGVVRIDGVAVPAASWSATEVTFVLSSALAGGTHVVDIVSGGETSNALTLTVAPYIASLSPAAGAGGASVTLTGGGFGAVQGSSVLSVGPVQLTADSWSDTAVSFTIPPTLGAGVHDVRLTVGGETSNARTLGVNPRIDSLSPANGLAGATVTLTGAGFGAVQGAGVVHFGAATAPVTAWYPTEITFTVPAGVGAGVFALSVEAAARTSNAVFFTLSPVLATVNPRVATGGDTVTASGSSFGSSGSLTLSGTAATVDQWFDTAVTFTVDASLTGGIHDVRLIVGGQATDPITIAVRPTVVSLAPAFGSAGTTVTLTGTNFGAVEGSSTVTVGGVAVIPDSWSASAIEFTVPATLAAGAHPVVVTVGAIASSPVAFTVQPRIDAVSPATGTGGASVTLTGVNFGAAQGASSLHVNGVAVAADAWDHTSIDFTLPDAVTAGATTISLLVGGQASNAVPFTIDPSLVSAAPSTGSGGTVVTLAGSNLGDTPGASRLVMGGFEIAPDAWSATAIQFTVPDSVTAGTHAISVVVGGRTSNALSLAVTPALNALTPTSGSAATTVSVSGTNFGAVQDAGFLTIGGTPVAADLWSSTLLQFDVPVTTPGGVHAVQAVIAGVASNALSFTVSPVVVSHSPVTGSAGTLVTLTGTNFGASAGSLTLGATALGATSWTHDEITFQVPSGLAAGVYDIVVTVGGQASAAVSFAVEPFLASLSPSSGTAATVISLSGTNFGAGGSVTLGGVAHTPTSWTSTSATVELLPTVSPGAVQVALSSGGRTSNARTFTAEPHADGVAPVVSGSGTIVTLAGSNFGAAQGVSELLFAGLPATVATWSATSVGFIVPTVANGTYSVAVLAGGLLSNAVTMTVDTVPPPFIASLSRGSGPVAVIVTVSGSEFGATQGTSSVTVGGLPATVLGWSDSAVVITIPTALAPGSHDVVVTRQGLASNAVAFSVTDDFSLLAADTLDCDPVDGHVDVYRLTLTRTALDASFDGYVLNGRGAVTARWFVAGHLNARILHGTAVPSACGLDTADDAVLYLAFDPSTTPDTGETPELTASAALLTDTGGVRLYGDSGNAGALDIAESDAAGPFVHAAAATEDDDVAGEPGAGAGDTLRIRFSEGTLAPDLAGIDLNTVFQLGNGHVFGGSAEIRAVTWSTVDSPNDRLIITFETGSHTVAVGDPIQLVGVDILDPGGNAAAAPADVPVPATITGTFHSGPIGPVVVSADYYDIDGNGLLDHVRVQFDKPVDDASFPGYLGDDQLNGVTTLWQIAGYANVRLDTLDTVDGLGGENDQVLWLAFGEGLYYDTGNRPDLTATAGQVGLRDLSGCYLNADNQGAGCMDASRSRLNGSDVVEGDMAPPVMVRASSRVDNDRIFVLFSEPVWGATGEPACGAGGELVPGDFVYHDNASGGATAILLLGTDDCAATDGLVELRTDSQLLVQDMNFDAIQVSAGNRIFDAAGNAMAAAEMQVIVNATAPYLLASSSFHTGGRYYLRVVYSEPVQPSMAMAPANYAIAEDPATGCVNLSPAPVTIAQVATNVYDLETAAQCGADTVPSTYYRITVSNVRDQDENEPVGAPAFTTTLGTAAVDTTQPRLLEAVSISPTTVRLTFSEPMRQGDVDGSAECLSGFTAARQCTADVDALAGTQLKYSISPSLGDIVSVEKTANPSVYLLTHAAAQAGVFYRVTVYASNAVAGIPLDVAGNRLRGVPENQASFRGRGSLISNLEDGPLFVDPFADNTTNNFAFTYANRVYLGPNRVNNGAFRFEADGANPVGVTFMGPAAPATCPYAPSFGIDGALSCATAWGPNQETGLVGFNSGLPNIGGTEYEILMVGPIKDNVSHVYFTQDVDTQLNWSACAIGGLTGGQNTTSAQTVYAYGANLYVGISSAHGTQAPYLSKIPLGAAGGVVSCGAGTELIARDIDYLGKSGTISNPERNTTGMVGIDSMLYVPAASGLVAADAFFIANNGGLAFSNGEPAAAASFGIVLSQAGFGAVSASTADDTTLVIDSLDKISPGRKGHPRMFVWQNTLFLVRNVGTAGATSTSAGGELWKCSSACTQGASWSRVFTTSAAGSDAGLESMRNIAVSLLEVNQGYLYVGFDNMQDGARIYRTAVVPGAPADFTEVGRIATAGCSNHSGDTGALGGQCRAFQFLSSAAIAKDLNGYLYATVGCTLSTESYDNGAANGVCDSDGLNGTFTPPSMSVIVQKD